MTLKIGILNGDDIGHEIVPAAVEVVRAAARRHDLAIDWTALPIMYFNGEGVEKDYVQALKWLTLAASGFSADPRMRDYSVAWRDRVAAQMTPAQIGEAQKLAREWKPAK